MLIFMVYSCLQQDLENSYGLIPNCSWPSGKPVGICNRYIQVNFQWNSRDCGKNEHREHLLLSGELYPEDALQRLRFDIVPV